MPEEQREAAYVAFTDVVGPDGEVWHVTVREGADEDLIEEMFQALLSVKEKGEEWGFWCISEHNPSRRKMPVNVARTVVTAPDPELAGTAAGARAPQAPTRPAGTATGPRQFWDLKKSPVSVNKIVVEGTKAAPKLAVWCGSPGLQHAAFHVPAEIMVGVVHRFYAVDRDRTEKMLTDVGTEIPLDPPWLYHWVPSRGEGKYKDLTEVTIPKLIAMKRPTPLSRGTHSITAPVQPAPAPAPQPVVQPEPQEQPPYIEEEDIPF